MSSFRLRMRSLSALGYLRKNKTLLFTPAPVAVKAVCGKLTTAIMRKSVSI